MRLAYIALLLTLATACSPKSTLPQGPQPYLIVKVLNPHDTVVTVGTISPDIPFEYARESPDRQDGVELYGDFVEKDASGFRIRWRTVQRSDGREVHSSANDVFVPWGVETTLESVPGYRVTAFYSPKPGHELSPNET
jgi:hypothetical protein